MTENRTKNLLKSAKEPINKYSRNKTDADEEIQTHAKKNDMRRVILHLIGFDQITCICKQKAVVCLQEFN